MRVCNSGELQRGPVSAVARIPHAHKDCTAGYSFASFRLLRCGPGNYGHDFGPCYRPKRSSSESKTNVALGLPIATDTTLDVAKRRGLNSALARSILKDVSGIIQLVDKSLCENHELPLALRQE